MPRLITLNVCLFYYIRVFRWDQKWKLLFKNYYGCFTFCWESVAKDPTCAAMSKVHAAKYFWYELAEQNLFVPAIRARLAHANTMTKVIMWRHNKVFYFARFRKSLPVFYRDQARAQKLGKKAWEKRREEKCRYLIFPILCSSPSSASF